ncbi:MAG: sel1 repeat family protein [Methylococcaceae bacterium]|nr:sel1 repeat family protein [Methylococcaceae bacterium]MDD1609742.1 sel1 repeat family protein [Methylococcaceae bacterium]MDD1616084.1 sel1 repeat family protein [Methylococcaceae bacterium]OYV18645.1 MAG: Sel1 repeat protein [Methylococcaceae bacterium NSP1-2]
MAGFLCIAMMKEPPYQIMIGVTEYEPDVWVETLLKPYHLLCYQGFYDLITAETLYLQQLLQAGIKAQSGRAFMAAPDEIIKNFMLVRDQVLGFEYEEQNKPPNTQMVFNDYETDAFYENNESEEPQDENELLYNQAKESEFASEKAFQLYQQAAQLDYKPAYIALAHAYLNGWGCKRNINAALIWVQRTLDALNQLNTDERIEVGELLHSLASEYENDSDQAIPDFKKAYQLNLQAAELGCELAYTSLACACLAGYGVEKNLNAALEWSMREIEANIIYGYNHATTCFVEAGMKPQAEKLWKRCFKEQAVETIATSCLRVYKKQVLAGSIAINPDIEMLFSSLAERLTNYQKELGVSIYDEEIAWLGVRDTCIVCHIPILPETARKTEGKCANCFIKELS